MKKRMMALVVVLVMVVTTLAMSGFVMAEEQEVLSNNLFVCDNFAEYLTTNSVTAPFNFTDPVTGAIGSMAGDSYAIAETVGTETYAKLSYSKAGHGFSSFFAFWDGTDSASVVGGKLVKGNYKVVLTVRGGGTAFATDNWGWRLVGSGSPDGALILGEKDNIKDIVADANGWKSVVVYVNVTTDTCDSFSMWYNTLSKDSAESNAQIKSVSVQRVIPQLSVVGDTEFDKAQPKDLAYTVDLAGNVFTSLSYLGDNLVKDTDYTLTGNALVIKKEFLSKLSAGAQDLLLTAGTKVATISIEIIPIQPTIP
ncbi:MAG: X2-like carbohydrate binding domain-containing protein, partial [Clostridia bacterium]